LLLVIATYDFPSLLEINLTLLIAKAASASGRPTSRSIIQINAAARQPPKEFSPSKLTGEKAALACAVGHRDANPAQLPFGDLERCHQ